MIEASSFGLPAEAHPVMHTGLDYWRSLWPAPQSLPGRQHVDPLGMPRLLPYTWLLEIHDTEPDAAIPRFRFRLLGSHVDLGFGTPKTGRWLHEIEPSFNSDADMQAPYIACAREAKPAHRRGRPRFRFAKTAPEVERMLLPLASDGSRVDMVLGFTVFYDNSGRPLQTTL